jgi:hypothetical protein
MRMTSYFLLKSVTAWKEDYTPCHQAMEIPVLKEYFENIVEVKDTRLRDQCTMECEFCDCTWEPLA